MNSRLPIIMPNKKLQSSVCPSPLNKSQSLFSKTSDIGKIDYHVHQILKKSDLARRMVSWAVELFKYNIQLIPKRSIKSQVLAYFPVQFIIPIGNKVSPHLDLFNGHN